MNAAVPTAVTGHHQYIPLNKLSASPLNHRKIFDETKMKELADSVSVQGVIQPILVRPLPDDRFEVVAGERRYRASKMAKLVDVPAVVRELTDVQVLELQVIENGQRVDPHPLEEAEGYEALLKCTRADGSKYTVDEIAVRIGKSKSYVYQRLKLTALCPAARDALRGGRIDASVAVLIARIPNDGLQRKALEDVVGNDYRGPMTFKSAQEHIRDRFMLRLADAPFDVKAIYFKGASAEVLAPICADCPKRTGNQVALFGDIDDADVCTDPSCFEGKRLAHSRKQIEDAEKAGRPVLRGDAAKAVLPNTWGDAKGGYLKLDGICYDDEKHRTYRQILGKKAVADQVTLVESPHKKGEIVELVKTDDVKAILKEKGVKAPAKEPSFNTAEDRAARERERAKQERERLVTARVCAAIHKKHSGALGKAEISFVIADMLDSMSLSEEDEAALCEMWGWKDLDAKKIDALSVKDAGRFLVDLLIFAHYKGPELASRLAKGLRIDVKKIEKDVAAEQKTKAKAS